MLAGSRELIDEAWRYKQMWGGAMRQAGIVAAAGLYALDHHVERLADDHANARALAEGLAEIAGVELDPEQVETNIVVFGVPDAPAFCAALERARACGWARSARGACAPSPTSTSTGRASSRPSRPPARRSARAGQLPLSEPPGPLIKHSER